MDGKYLFLHTSVPQMSVESGNLSLHRNLSLMPVVWNDFEMQQQYFDNKMSNYLFT